MSGDRQIDHFTVQRYTDPAGAAKGVLTATMKDGKTLPVTSASEPGEVPGTGSLPSQKDAGVTMAASRGVSVGFVDIDLANKVIAAKEKAAFGQ